MRGPFVSIISRQTPPPGDGEGLPYWTFWLLLCIIMLLVVFIFLRDKDLRQRINLFFFGAKKKLIKLRLQARLKRECRKKDDLILSLGIKVWDSEIKIPGGEKIRQELAKLEEQRQELEQESKDLGVKIKELEDDQQKFIQKHTESVSEQESARKPYLEKLAEIKVEERTLEVQVRQKQKELEGIIRGIQSAAGENETKSAELNKQKEEMDRNIKGLVEKRLALEKERKAHQEKADELDKKLSKIEESGKKRIREFHKEIREWKKNEEKVREKIEHVVKKKDPLFARLGMHADETRADQESLTLFYSQIDRSKERIEELEQQIKNL
jgi:chromosome segregation ATPase